MTRYLSARDLDWSLLLITLALCGIGVLQIYSATLDSPYHSAWWRQILYVAGGLVLMWLILAVDYHTLLHYVPSYYIISVAALLVTYVVGQTAFGSRRWIPLGGGLHLQVSEFVKLMIILLVARYLAEIKTETLEIREMTILSSLVLVPTLLVLKQPDLGTSLTYIAILMVGAFLAGLRRKYVVVIAVVTMLVLPVGWYFLKDYQRARLVSFLDPDRDPQGTGYQLIQSQIAVGAGGMFGKGVTKGTQTQLRFLPVPHKDFIFSALAEEHGFVGVVIVLSLFFVMIMRIVQNAQTAPDPRGYVYLHGGGRPVAVPRCWSMWEWWRGLMPVTGIPLAVHERRWFQYLVEFFGFGAGE